MVALDFDQQKELQQQEFQSENSKIFTIHNSTDKELGEQIRKELDNLAITFINLDDQEKTIKRSKKSIILEIGYKFDKLREIGEYPFPRKFICSSMYRYLGRKGYDIADSYVRKVLSENAPQYLNTTYQGCYSGDNDIKLGQEEILNAVKILKEINFTILKNEQIQDLIPSIIEILDMSERYASENNIALIDSNPIVNAVPFYDSEELDPFRDHIPCDKPDPRTTPSPLAEGTIELGESIVRTGQTILNTGKMMREYPPNEEDREMEINAVTRIMDWKDYWDNLSIALKNGTDRKYRRSVIQWTQIAEDENNWGKHAASSKNPYISKFKDPVTGEWKQEIRKLTREQIGDVAPKAREFARLFKSLVPCCLDFIRWSEEYMFPYASGLSTKLHDKLQDRSLR